MIFEFRLLLSQKQLNPNILISTKFLIDYSTITPYCFLRTPYSYLSQSLLSLVTRSQNLFDSQTSRCLSFVTLYSPDLLLKHLLHSGVLCISFNPIILKTLPMSSLHPLIFFLKARVLLYD